MDKVDDHSQSLKLVIQTSFHGFLKIQAINNFSSDLASVPVKFGENKRFVEKLHEEFQNEFMSRKETILGQTAEFECSFPMYDTGNITWFVGGQILQSGKIEKSDSSTEYRNAQILRIKNVTNEDEGKYECKLTPKVKPSYGMIFLKRNLTTTLSVVHGQAAKIQSLVQRRDKIQIEIECKVLGYPQPNLTWFKDQIPLLESRALYRNSWSEQKTYLTISHLKIMFENDEDAGNYSCVAVNMLGSDTKALWIDEDSEFASCENL